MHRLVHRLGAGVLLASAVMLGGCLTADKPKAPANYKKPATTNTLPPNPQMGFNSPTGSGAQPGAASQPAIGAQPNRANSTTNGQPNQFGPGATSGAGNDPTSRFGVTSGPVNTNTGAVQPAGGIGANPVNSNLQPIGSSNTSKSMPANSGNIVPIRVDTPADAGTPLAPLDDVPSRSIPKPVSMQTSDRDLNNFRAPPMPRIDPVQPVR